MMGQAWMAVTNARIKSGHGHDGEGGADGMVRGP